MDGTRRIEILDFVKRVVSPRGTECAPTVHCGIASYFGVVDECLITISSR